LGHGWPFVDLAVYRWGGQAISSGAHLYRLRFPGALAFTYPPLSAQLFVPLAKLRLAILEPLVSAGNIVLLPVMLGFALRLAPVRSWLTREQAVRLALVAAALALWLEPVWSTLRYGQIDLLIATLILADLSRPDASRWKGAGIGLATGLKLTPAIFIAYLLLSRRYRAASVSLAVLAGTIAAGFVATPGDSSEFWGGAFIDPSRVGRIENAANQTLRGAWARVLHSPNVQTWWLATAMIVGLIGMLLAVRAGRRGNEAQGFSLCALTGLLISPISWSHHWVLAIPALGLLAVEARQRAWRVGVASVAFAAAIGYSHVIWWVPINHPLHSELHLDLPQILYADAYVLLGLGALALATWRALASEPTERLAAVPVRLSTGAMLVATVAFVVALAACGSTPSARTSAQPPASPANLRSVSTSTQSPSSSSAATAGAAARARPRLSRIDRIVDVAKSSYHSETKGRALLRQLGRIARDRILLNALSRGDVTGAQAEADAQLRSPANHFTHVTRISVVRGSRVLVNATVNSDGVFVVAPGSRVLRSRGRPLGTLLVSIQDVTGYVKVVHDLTGADVVARGASGRVRTSRGAPTGVRLPPSGHVTIAGRRYSVRSFRELGWGNEPLMVWILLRA
jgi:alpha-1,2-mannosyltransferase